MYKKLLKLEEEIKSLPCGDRRASLNELAGQIREKLCELDGAKTTKYKEKVIEDLFSNAEKL